jgi:putative DNA primase/helicase
MSAVDDFRSAMAEYDLYPNDIVADGHFHRFRAPGEKNGKKAGWYVLHQNGGPAAGAFGDHRNCETIRWHEKYAAPRGKDAAQKRAELKQQADEAKRQRDAEVESLHDAAAYRAEKLWARLKPAKPDHPYLAAKKIKPHVARACYSSLVLPVRDVRTHKLTTLQFISVDGQKKLLKGSRKKGCAIFLSADGADNHIILAEGFATSATTLEASGSNAVAALDKDNLTEVAIALHETRKGAALTIAADNDVETEGNPGLQAAYRAARKVKALVAIPRLPGNPEKKCDFNDLAAAEGMDTVRGQLAAATPAIPLINADSHDLTTVSKECWTALQTANHPERFFLFGDLPVRTKQDDKGRILTEELTEPRMRYELARSAEWFRIEVKTGRVLVGKPARDHVQDVLAIPNPPLPMLYRITDVPVFNRDGTLITRPGYAKGILYAPPPDLTIPEIPAEPTSEQFEIALGTINELIHDFNFPNNSDKAHAIGVLMQPFVREMIDGPTPLYRFESPTPGSGKGLLVDMLLYPSLGNRVSHIVESFNDDAEWRKQITTELIKGNGAFIVDNVRKVLESGVLAKATTDIVWDDRLLGTNRSVALPILWLWAITANNPVLSGELVRRSPRVRIDPKCEHPELRTDFKHRFLRQWVAENRPLLIWSVLVIIQNWIACECLPPSCKPLGSFENWTRVVGGIVEAAGYPDFLGAMDDDPIAETNESGVLHKFVKAWHERFPAEKEVQTSDLYSIAKEIGSKLLLGKGDSEQSQKVALGNALMKFRDRVIDLGEDGKLDEFQIKYVGKKQRASVWQLMKVKKDHK